MTLLMFSMGYLEVIPVGKPSLFNKAECLCPQNLPSAASFSSVYPFNSCNATISAFKDRTYSRYAGLRSFFLVKPYQTLYVTTLMESACTDLGERKRNRDNIKESNKGRKFIFLKILQRNLLEQSPSLAC